MTTPRSDRQRAGGLASAQGAGVWSRRLGGRIGPGDWRRGVAAAIQRVRIAAADFERMLMEAEGRSDWISDLHATLRDFVAFDSLS